MATDQVEDDVDLSLDGDDDLDDFEEDVPPPKPVVEAVSKKRAKRTSFSLANALAQVPGGATTLVVAGAAVTALCFVGALFGRRSKKPAAVPKRKTRAVTGRSSSAVSASSTPGSTPKKKKRVVKKAAAPGTSAAAAAAASSAAPPLREAPKPTPKATPEPSPKKAAGLPALTRPKKKAVAAASSSTTTASTSKPAEPAPAATEAPAKAAPAPAAAAPTPAPAPAIATIATSKPEASKGPVLPARALPEKVQQPQANKPCSPPITPGAAADNAAAATHSGAARPALPKLSAEQERSVAAILSASPAKEKSPKTSPKPRAPATASKPASDAAKSQSDAVLSPKSALSGESASVEAPKAAASASALSASVDIASEKAAAVEAAVKQSWSEVVDADDRSAAAAAAAAKERLAQEAHEKIAHAKLNADARPFVPPSTALGVTSPKATSPKAAPAAATPAADAAAAPAAPQRADTPPEAASADALKPSATASPPAPASPPPVANGTASSRPESPLEEGEIRDEEPPEGVAVDVVDAPAAEEEEENDDTPPECAEDDTEVFEHTPLELAGKDIDPDSPLTADEQAADEQLLKIAQSLQSQGAYSHEQMVQRGITILQQDVQFCATHACRPSKYAEHASTAADFFFQVGAFKEAEAMLDGAIQAASMSGNFNLEATLVNNMGTILRKQHKFKRALSLHRQHMDVVLEKHGIESHYIVLARNNLVEVLELLKKKDDALNILLQQAQQCRARAEQAEAESSTGVPIPKANGSKAKAADGEGEQNDPIKSARASTARCYLDLARFTSRCNNVTEAGTYARTALEFSKKAHGEDSPGTAIYLSFLAGNLKLQSERSNDSSLMREARSVFQKLSGIIEEAEPISRNLPTLYRTLAELSMDLGEHEEAYKYGQQVVSVMAQIMGGNQYHTHMQSTWHFIELLHNKGGDAAGAEIARKAILKCKASGVKMRDSSHKKKLASTGRGKADKRR